MTAFDVAALRRQFPSLLEVDEGRAVAYFDGPGGTQVPESVIDAVADYYRHSNANSGGAFLTSRRSDAIASDAHVAMADMLGAASEGEIAFGANMTTLTQHVSRSIAATLVEGDEIVVTGLDHEANVGPWRSIAGDRGIRVRTVDVRLDDCTLDLDHLDTLLSPRTRVVAVGGASNAGGTSNPIAQIVGRAHAVGAWVYVDAVHYAPHAPIEVVATGVDFLACSSYKFFGPHAGVLYIRSDVRDRLPSYKIRPAHDRFETGTANFEGLAGVLAAVEYLASVGRSHGDATRTASRREAVHAAMRAIRRYEMELYARLAAGLGAVRGVRLYGITDPARFLERTPTAALTVDGVAPRAVAEALGRDGIAVWDGDFYATGLIERLGLANTGGVVRIGLTHYNTVEEIDAVVGALSRIADRTGAAAA